MSRIFRDVDINLQILIRANPEENLGKVWAVRAILDNIFHQAIEELLQAASVEQIALLSRVIQFLNDRLEDMPNKGSATALANALQIAVEGLSAPVPQLPGHPQEPVEESTQMATEEVISQGLLADLAEAQEDADGIMRRIPDEIKEARSLTAQVRTETEKIRDILRLGGSIEPGPYRFNPDTGTIHREADQEEGRREAGRGERVQTAVGGSIVH